MRRMLLFAAIAVVFASGTIDVFGQDKVDAPTYKDGDSWTFRSKLGGTSDRSSTDLNGDYELTYSGGKVKALKVEGEQKNVTSDRVGDLWVMLALEVMVSKYQYLQFPISVGKKWSQRNEMTISGKPYWVDSQTEVTSVEEVATPAGTFRAFKIERNTRGAKGALDQRRVYFYSPQTGTVVKYHMESALGAVSDIELIKFGPGR